MWKVPFILELSGYNLPISFIFWHLLQQEDETIEENSIHAPTEENLPTPASSTSSLSRSFKRKRESPSTTPVLHEAMNILRSLNTRKQEKDEFAIFDEQVAIKVRKLPCAHARFMVQHIITNTLFEAEMGKYDKPFFGAQQYHYPQPQPMVYANYSTNLRPPTTSTTPSEVHLISDTMSSTTSVTEDIDSILCQL
nr:uncharacterized protein LOC111414527 [Onthophagus taurus]